MCVEVRVLECACACVGVHKYIIRNQILSRVLAIATETAKEKTTILSSSGSVLGVRMGWDRGVPEIEAKVDVVIVMCNERA